MKLKILDNDEFVRRNFTKLIKRYPRRRIVISNGEIFTGEDAVNQARLKYPRITPLSFPVPSPEEFFHIL